MCAVEIQDIVLSAVCLLASSLCTVLKTSVMVIIACVFVCTPTCPNTVVTLVTGNWTAKPDLPTPSALYFGGGETEKRESAFLLKIKKKTF